MFNANRPNLSDLPTSAQLLKSTGFAALIAGGLLVAVVLPAEYGVDPTRIGSVFGLTEMGRIKRQLAAEAVADAAADASGGLTPAATPSLAAAPPAPTANVAAGERADEMSVILQPDEAAEIKLTMQQGARARFSWSSSGGKVNFDTHGDRPGLKYFAYGKGSSVKEEGQLTAAFTGKHGWFWRNRTGARVVITLKTSGDYTEIKRVA